MHPVSQLIQNNLNGFKSSPCSRPKFEASSAPFRISPPHPLSFKKVFYGVCNAPVQKKEQIEPNISLWSE